MRKLILILFLLFSTSVSYADVITVDAVITPDDVTITWLNTEFRATVVNALNSFPGSNIQDTSIPNDKLDANADPVNRWNVSFNSFVAEGLLPPTATGLTSTTTAGIAIISGEYVVKAATPNAYTLNQDTYVDLSKTGVYTYTAVNNDATAPAVANNSIRIAKVVTDGTDVTSVSDLRATSISLGAVEDFGLEGLELRIAGQGNTDAITVDAGVCYVGTTRVAKTTATRLEMATAGDWHDAVVDAYAANGWCYVGVDNVNNIKLLGDNPPNKSDSSGNSGGRRRYWYNSSETKYWRVIGCFRVYNGATDYISPKFKQNTDWILTEVTADAKYITTMVSQSGWSPKVSLANAVPPISDLAVVGCYLQSDTNGLGIQLRPASEDAANLSWLSQDAAGLTSVIGGAAEVTFTGELLCPLSGDNELQFINHADQTTNALSVKGYKLFIR